MTEVEELSSTIETIYDSAVDPSQWRLALRHMTVFVGGWASGLYIKDAASRTGMMHHHDGIMADTVNARYFDSYVKLDPCTVRHFFLGVGEAASTTDLLPYAEFVETRFYREWAEPQGLVDHLAAVLDKSQTSVSIFGVFRSKEQGLVDEPMRSRMRLVVPHVRRAVMIGGLLKQSTIVAQSLAETLDGVGSAVFLVDASGAIEHANLAGLKMLSQGGPVREVDGHLAGVERELRAMFATDLPVPSFDPIVTGDGIRYLVHILPLRGPRRGAGGASAAVFVRPAELPSPAMPELIARAYKLTPAELRTLLAAVESTGVADMADALGISETTVKFHLRGVYAKTGSHRQADLVKLVAGFSGP